jgi:hypothetical protein
MLRSFARHIPPASLAAAILASLAPNPWLPAVHGATPSVAQQQREPPDVYAPFLWLIGAWESQPIDQDGLTIRGRMEFSWGERNLFMRYVGRRLVDGRCTPDFEGIMLWHGVNERIVLTGAYVSSPTLVMEQGTVEAVGPDTLRRQFEVVFAKGEPLPFGRAGTFAPPGGTTMRFRQIWRRASEDRLHEEFAMLRDGKWLTPLPNPGGPDGFVWTRVASPNGC